MGLNNKEYIYMMLWLVGIILTIINFIIILPKNGPLGIIIAIISGGFAGYYARQWNLLREQRYKSEIHSDNTNSIDFDVKLRKLNNLKEDGLISENEFKDKRKEIMEEKW
ncbi:MAG: SHOCT domain-containing protein [Firmicutes bacterium]|nr:SHOCT domain-containing protein [Bacillota bacterium]